jgi:hypothetical protein
MNALTLESVNRRWMGLEDNESQLLVAGMKKTYKLNCTLHCLVLTMNEKGRGRCGREVRLSVQQLNCGRAVQKLNCFTQRCLDSGWIQLKHTHVLNASFMQ